MAIQKKPMKWFCTCTITHPDTKKSFTSRKEGPTREVLRVWRQKVLNNPMNQIYKVKVTEPERI